MEKGPARREDQDRHPVPRQFSHSLGFILSPRVAIWEVAMPQKDLSRRHRRSEVTWDDMGSSRMERRELDNQRAADRIARRLLLVFASLLGRV